MNRALLAGLWLVLLTAGGVQAGEQSEPTRNWGFGWETGLTLRRQLGVWQVGVSAGPNDRLSASKTTRFDPDWPDSLQGVVKDGDGYHRESGYVRLSVARRVASRRNLTLSGLVAGRHSWSDESWDHSYFYLSDADWTESSEKRFTKTWQVNLGARVAWYPTLFLSLETEFGLQYEWESYEDDDWDRQSGEAEWLLQHKTGSSHTFSEYGTGSLLYNLRIIFWL